MSYNHTGAVGLAYWEEVRRTPSFSPLAFRVATPAPTLSRGAQNWPNWLIMKDPMLSTLDFLRCGNTFFPIPMVPVPIPSERGKEGRGER